MTAVMQQVADRWGVSLHTSAATPVDIMVDIDDVLCPTIDEIHELARVAGLHKGEVGPAWKGWEVYGCEPDAYWDLWLTFAASGGYLNTPPIPGSVEALRRLYWAGHRIHLVTARGFMANAEQIREWTPQWVETFAIPHHSLVFAKDKVAAQDTVGARFTYAIDDSPKNIGMLRRDGIEAYLLSHHHNRDAQGLPRVESVGAFADLILKETL